MKYFLLVSIFLYTSLFAEVKIYTNIEPPQQFEENGKLTGVGTDIIYEIQKRINSHEKINVYPWSRAFAIVKKQPNTILYLAAKVDSRLPYFHFVGPILAKSYKLYGRNGSDIVINSLDEAKKINSISCVKDDIRDVFLKKFQFNNMIYAEDHASAFDMMYAHKSTLWASSDWENKIHLSQKNKEPNSIKPLFTIAQSKNYIAFNINSDPKIIKLWEDTLKQIKNDGTMDKIAKKWAKKLNLNLQYIKGIDAIGIVE